MLGTTAISAVWFGLYPGCLDASEFGIVLYLTILYLFSEDLSQGVERCSLSYYFESCNTVINVLLIVKIYLLHTCPQLQQNRIIATQMVWEVGGSQMGLSFSCDQTQNSSLQLSWFYIRHYHLDLWQSSQLFKA